MLSQPKVMQHRLMQMPLTTKHNKYIQWVVNHIVFSCTPHLISIAYSDELLNNMKKNGGKEWLDLGKESLILERQLGIFFL